MALIRPSQPGCSAVTSLMGIPAVIAGGKSCRRHCSLLARAQSHMRTAFPRAESSWSLGGRICVLPGLTELVWVGAGKISLARGAEHDHEDWHLESSQLWMEENQPPAFRRGCIACKRLAMAGENLGALGWPDRSCRQLNCHRHSQATWCNSSRITVRFGITKSAVRNREASPVKRQLQGQSGREPHHWASCHRARVAVSVPPPWEPSAPCW